MTPNLAESTLGTLDTYELLARIGEADTGTLYKARQQGSGDLVAIKMVPPDRASDPAFLRRFEQECRTATLLNHPNLVRALDYCDTDESCYLVMEYVEGESLAERIERDGPLPEAEAIRLIGQVCQGLHWAHKRSMLHGNLKPENIRLTPAGQVKLLNLGQPGEGGASRDGTRPGSGPDTPHFMAPEQFRSAKSADVRSDIYSVGALLYFMVTGKAPFASAQPLEAWMMKAQNTLTPPRQLVPGLSARIDETIRRALSADPGLRPGSCEEFLRDLTGASDPWAVVSSDGPPPPDLWYLLYQGVASERFTTITGSTAEIRRWHEKGLLANARRVRVSRSRSGPYIALRNHPEFRDLSVVLLPPPEEMTGGAEAAEAPLPNTEAPEPRVPEPVAVEEPPLPESTETLAATESLFQRPARLSPRRSALREKVLLVVLFFLVMIAAMILGQLLFPAR